jgi:lipoyl-dependent peroxiredoxin
MQRPGRLAVCDRAGMIVPMSIEVVFTAESTATGGGRDGHVKSSDGRIDLDTRMPKEAGGNGEGTNPEQLFSAGYAACFLGALRLVARNNKIDIDDASGITAQVGFGKDPAGGFAINAHLIGYLPGLEQSAADDLMDKAHEVCPYSKATRGNIDVTLSAKV